MLVFVFSVLSLSAPPPPAAATAQTDLYVSPAGDDNNPGTISRPFKTIEKAKESLRSVKSKMTRNVTVHLRGGTYSIDHTIRFDAADSGTNGFDVVYKNYPNETPVISGGKRISGWELDGAGRWKAKTEIDNFRQLYANGRRATRARGKELPGAELFGGDGYKTSNAEMAEWKNQSDIEFYYDNQWDRTICKVAGVKRGEAGTAVISMLQPYFTLAKLKDGKQAKLPTHIENALELLDEPGEWYLDRSSRTVYYKPRDKENIETTEIIVPVVETLMELKGTLDQPVHNIRFEGVTFSYAGWLRPSEIGLVDVQANFIIDPKNLIARPGTVIANVHNQNVKSPSNIILHAANSIRFERCVFTKLGSGGMDIEFGSQNNTIQGCHFYDISGSGLQIGDVVDHHPDDVRAIVRNNKINNNFIRDVAKEYLSGVGVFAGYTDSTQISHNEICHLPYSGISLGWGWGEEDQGGSIYYQPFNYQEPTPAKNNIVENNHIHDINTRFWDGGGVYTLGNMPGTVIRGNLVHDNLGWPGGIYLDEGSGFIEVTGNIVYNVYPLVINQVTIHPSTPMNYNNRVQNRIATCKEHGNFFNIKPGDLNFPVSIAERAGLQTPYQNLLDAEHHSHGQLK
jgi:hypothetical protein